MTTTRTNLLSPEERAALERGIESGSIPVDTGFNTQARIRKYDLATAESSVSLNLQSLEMINERFIRVFRLRILEVLRTSPRISPSKVKIVKFGEYLGGLSVPTSVNIVRMDPLRGYSIVVLDPNIIFSSLDSFFGGFGRGVSDLPAGRLFTPTETRIIKILLDTLFRSQQEAWAPIIPVQFEHVSSEINPQFAQIADENDMVVVSRFQSEAGKDSVAGFVDMVTPYVALKPLREQLSSRVQTGDGNEDSDQIWREQLSEAAHEAELRLDVRLGALTLPLGKLNSLREGDWIPFRKFDHARACIGEIPAFDVEVGALGAQLAIKVKDFNRDFH